MRGKALSRDSTKDVAFVNLKADKFSYLNITSIIFDLVDKASECGLACLEIPSCLSYNLAVLPDNNSKLLCEMLPSHKYNNSDKLIASPLFHHFSIVVRLMRELIHNVTHTGAKFYLVSIILRIHYIAPVNNLIRQSTIRLHI